jgi:hypothetical protein
MALVAATDGFVPTPASLTQACELLTLSRNPADPRYAQAAAQLEVLLVQPEFLVHATYIFARLTPAHLPDDVRQLAGLVVKQGARTAPLAALPLQVGCVHPLNPHKRLFPLTPCTLPPRCLLFAALSVLRVSPLRKVFSCVSFSHRRSIARSRAVKRSLSLSFSLSLSED